MSNTIKEKLQQYGLMNLIIIGMSVLIVIVLVYFLAIILQINGYKVKFKNKLKQFQTVVEYSNRIKALSERLPEKMLSEGDIETDIKQDFGSVVGQITKKLGINYDNFSSYDTNASKRYTERKFNITFKDISRKDFTQFVFEVTKALKVVRPQVINIAFDKDKIGVIKSSTVSFVYYDWKKIE